MKIVALLLALLATGASADPRETRPMPYGAKIYHDDERSVTCWQISSGVSCIPDNQIAGSQRQLSPHEQESEPTPATAPGHWDEERYSL